MNASLASAKRHRMGINLNPFTWWNGATWGTIAGLIGKKTPGGLTIENDEMLIGYYLDEARVAAVHGAAFGVEPAFRVSYATSEAILTEACNRIATASNALR